MRLSKDKDIKRWANMSDGLGASEAEANSWTCVLFSFVAAMLAAGLLGLILGHTWIPIWLRGVLFIGAFVGAFYVAHKVCRSRSEASTEESAADTAGSDKAAAEAAAATAAAKKIAADKAAADKAAKEKAAAEKAAAAEKEAAAKAAAEKAAADKAAAEADYDGDGVVEGADEGTRPEALTAARDGQADNLKLIKGVGPKLEQLCNSLGFYHFDQIAGWTADEVAWVDANLEGFKGRVSRDDWVAQAKILATGGETEFSARQ